MNILYVFKHLQTAKPKKAASQNNWEILKIYMQKKKLKDLEKLVKFWMPH